MWTFSLCYGMLFAVFWYQETDLSRCHVDEWRRTEAHSYSKFNYTACQTTSDCVWLNIGQTNPKDHLPSHAPLYTLSSNHSIDYTVNDFHS